MIIRPSSITSFAEGGALITAALIEAPPILEAATQLLVN
jgi:hypothetical protein